MRINKDMAIVISIYIITFAIVLQYNLLHTAVNDSFQEYETYLSNIKEGWMYRSNLVNSALMSTWVPAMIQRITNWDSLTIFRVFPAFFYPLMPVFTYLIARKYLAIKLSLVAVLVIILNSHILYFPDIGRNGIALGFMAGMVWALLYRKLIPSVVFASLMVFSHYGASLISVVAMGIVFITVLIWKRVLLRQYLIIFCVLITLIGVWNFGIARYSGNVMFNAGFETASPSRGESMGTEILWSKFSGIIDRLSDEFPNLETRGADVQGAFGLTFKTLSVPGKLELLFNWIVVLVITLGLFLALRYKAVDRDFKIMLVSLYGLIVLVVAVPWLSVFYGTQRVYFTASIALATCLPIGVDWIARKTKLPFLLMASLVLIPYALSTSGLIYLPFGLVKYFTVYTP